MALRTGPLPYFINLRERERERPSFLSRYPNWWPAAPGPWWLFQPTGRLITVPVRIYRVQNFYSEAMYALVGTTYCVVCGS